ncbi:Tetratricopeptide repeat protein [compost metagenome]
MIQVKAAEAWLLFKQGKTDEALKQMYLAADMEDKTEKHPVTPGEVVPARELLADMLLEMNKPDEALKAYEADLKRHRNRFNGLYGAGLAAQRSNNPEKATLYYKQLAAVANSADAKRPELDAARLYLGKMEVARNKKHKINY